MPFNPSQGITRGESRLRRALKAAPLALLGPVCLGALLALFPLAGLVEILRVGRFPDNQGGWIRIPKRMLGVPGLDAILRRASVVLSPSALDLDPGAHDRTLTFLVDSGLVYTIMLVESSRRANRPTPMYLPNIFASLATHGIGVFFPIYYLVHYTWSPVSVFAAADMRLVDRCFTLALLPSAFEARRL
ncbi:hypothetical protein VTK73DRAFT_6308 [Phialemonium thermophilum]|uniref:Uncharacterized protein n=1 Tax=Phialemonium thermophilum TaxID=223376 RepID=A0ABR3WKB3_9PEZI